MYGPGGGGGMISLFGKLRSGHRGRENLFSFHPSSDAAGFVCVTAPATLEPLSTSMYSATVTAEYVSNSKDSVVPLTPKNDTFLNISHVLAK
jgi:hypothetical protein